MSTTPAPRGEIGFWTCVALVVGNTIGIGIFMQPASLAPYGYNAFIAWAITALGCVALALVIAALARRMPGADGPLGYIQAALGERAAFVTMWCYWASVWVANAAIAVGVTGYLQSAAPWFAQFPGAVVACGLIWLFTAINLFGIKTGGRVQVVTATLKILPMFLVVGLGAALLFSEPAAFQSQALPAPVTLPAVMAAATIALFAMLGLESAAVPASRVKDPERTVPRATVVGTLVVAAIYIVVILVALLLIPEQQLAQSAAPFVDVLERLMGEGNGRWVAFFVVISGAGALNGWTLLGGELTRTLAGHRLLPPGLSRLNRHGAPWIALLFVGTMSTAVALMNYSKTLADGFTFMSIVVTGANLPLYFFCALALLFLWYRDAASPGAWAWTFGTLGLAYSVFTFVGVGMSEGATALAWVVALAASGLPLYWWYHRAGAAR